MNTVNPRSAELRRQVAGYIADAQWVTGQCLARSRGCDLFRDVYRVSLAAETVFKGLATLAFRPRLAAARSIVLRVPLLVCIGQSSVAHVELRRFLELALWTVYFTDHPVEWRSLESASDGGFAQDQRKPIAYAAHRELGYYVEYARELMGSEPSGLGKSAVENIKQVSRELNVAVHAGGLARATRRMPPHDALSDAAFRAFSGLQRRAFSNCCLLIAAYKRSQFNRLTAAARSQFDWLVGPAIRRQVRRGPFGLP